MTEHSELVEKAKRRIHAQQWGEETLHLLAQDGYIELAKRNGSIVRTYHRSSDGYEKGEVVVMHEAMSIDRLVVEAPSA